MEIPMYPWIHLDMYLPGARYNIVRYVYPSLK